MTGESQFPTENQIEAWRARWTSQRVEQLFVEITDPQWTGDTINTLKWYKAPTFLPQCLSESLTEEFPEKIVLDLRGLYYRIMKDEPIVLILPGANLQHSNFGNAELQYSVLWHANLQHAFFGQVNLQYANLGYAILQHAHFDGAELQYACLWYADLQYVNLISAELHHADIGHADLQHANLKFANLQYSSLWEANLQYTNLGQTDLQHTNLNRADLQHADLWGANLQHTGLVEAKLVNANLAHARFADCALAGMDLRSNEGYATCDQQTWFGRSWRYPYWRSALRRLFRLLPFLFILLKLRLLRKILLATRKENNEWIYDRSAKLRDRKSCEERMNTCSEIRLCLKDNGLFHQAAIYYEQEEYWRTRQLWFEGKKWIASLRWFFAEKLMGYGERPGRIIASSLVSIGLFSIIYYLFGIAVADENGKFGDTYVGIEQCLFSLEALEYLMKSLQFSMENFTTLGFGVINPAEGISHWFATFEGLIGALMISMATVTFTRKVIRD